MSVLRSIGLAILLGASGCGGGSSDVRAGSVAKVQNSDKSDERGASEASIPNGPVSRSLREQFEANHPGLVYGRGVDYDQPNSGLAAWASPSGGEVLVIRYGVPVPPEVMGDAVAVRNVGPITLYEVTKPSPVSFHVWALDASRRGVAVVASGVEAKKVAAPLSHEEALTVAAVLAAS